MEFLYENERTPSPEEQGYIISLQAWDSFKIYGVGAVKPNKYHVTVPKSRHMNSTNLLYVKFPDTVQSNR